MVDIITVFAACIVAFVAGITTGAYIEFKSAEELKK
jgi:hypothetical protein